MTVPSSKLRHIRPKFGRQLTQMFSVEGLPLEGRAKDHGAACPRRPRRPGGRRERQHIARGGGPLGKAEDQSHAKQLAYAPGVEMPREIEAEGQAVPVACGSGITSAGYVERLAGLLRTTGTPASMAFTQPRLSTCGGSSAS